MNEQIQSAFSETAAINQGALSRRKYEAPSLVVYGDAVAATLGADGAFPEGVSAFTTEESW